MRPAPIALLTMASVSPRAGRARDRVSAAVSRSSRRATHSTPARRNAASNASSPVPEGSSQQAAGPDRHDRAQPRRRAGGRQEDPAVLDAAHVQQDGAGARIARQPVERHAEAEIGVAADADDVAEADAVRPGPVQHRAAQRGGLRHQRQPPLGRRQVGARGVEAQLGHDQPERPRSQHAHAGAPRQIGQPQGRAVSARRARAIGRSRSFRCARPLHRGQPIGRGQRDCVGQHDGRETPLGGERRQRRRQTVRIGDHRQVGRDRQVGHRLIGEHPRHGVQRGIDRQHRPLEPAVAQVAHDLAAQPAAGADHREAIRAEQRGRGEAAGGLGADQVHIAPQHTPIAVECQPRRDALPICQQLCHRWGCR